MDIGIVHSRPTPCFGSRKIGAPRRVLSVHTSFHGSGALGDRACADCPLGLPLLARDCDLGGRAVDCFGRRTLETQSAGVGTTKD